MVIKIYISCLLLLNCSFRVYASDVDDLEKLVGQWIKLKKEIAQTDAKWQKQKKILASEKMLLQQQNNELNGLLKKKQEQKNRANEELNTQKQKCQQKEKLITNLQNLLLINEEFLHRWSDKLPELLKQEIQLSTQELQEKNRTVTLANFAKRFQNILGLYSNLQQLNNSIHCGKMLMKNQKREFEAEVIFLGVAIGYAISPDGKWAAVGIPDKTSWQWQWQNNPKLATTIKQAISSYRKESAGKFVLLPVKAKQEVKK